ncbi:hypothetical protein F0562_007392 [Nyssa sinensis]|uniref:Uncharacterized protein n=1 Tax=Nyssa sinensis TaxID=561372 RepID=A0A5J5A3A7_9ASTE|nr:hypothetical protein F0562_007392 [Nyssa sinensis]
MSRVKRCKGDGSAVNRGVARRAFVCINCWFDLDWGGRKCVGAGNVAAGAVHGDFPEQLVLREAAIGEIPCSDQGRWVSRWSTEDDGTVVLAWMELNLRLNLSSNQSY